MTLFEVSYQYFVVNIASDALLMFYASTVQCFQVVCPSVQVRHHG